MRWVLILIIRLYWWSIPPANRNRCLYKESCSRAVYSELQKSIKDGLKMLLFRYRSCRPGYKIENHNGKISIMTNGGIRIEHNEINPSIINNHTI